MKKLPRKTILTGDAATVLQALPSASVDCVITSPPYYQLRDYGVVGQLGLEPAVDDWVAGLVQVLAEVARVLKPGGELLLLEHVRSVEGSGLTRWQDRLERPWGWLGAGCHPNRDTAATLGAGFDVSGLQEDRFPGHVPPIVKPLIKGAARPVATE
jgi:SAM-dependent methyltransferase